MKARLQIDVTGLRQALRELPYQMEKSSYRAATRAGAAALAREVKAGTPVRTGALKRSVSVALGRRPTRIGGTRFVVYFKGAVYRIAHLVEFGTAHSAARPFIRPAIERAFGPAVAASAEILGKHLEKNAAKLAAKGGKAHFARGLKQQARAAAWKGRR